MMGMKWREMLMLHMIVEQTYEYAERMNYDPATRTFVGTGGISLLYMRNFTRPYGWIKESGTPPEPHWGCLLMSDAHYALGDEVEVKVIGVYKRYSGNHEYVVVEATRDIDDYAQLSEEEKNALSRLFHEGAGWLGKEAAEYCMKHHGEAL